MESFIIMERLFEFMFIALEYLLGSHLATWGILGILFDVIFDTSGHFWEHFGHPPCIQKWDEAPNCPKRHYLQALTYLGLVSCSRHFLMHLNHFGAPVGVDFTTLGVTFEAFWFHFRTLGVIFGAL